MHTICLSFPWNYEKELREINERSAQGLHLTHLGLLGRREERDEGRSYRYVMDAAEQGNFTELLYEKQGWELVCRRGRLLFFRKEILPGRLETEYVLHGVKDRHAVADEIHRRIRPLDVLRNLLLIAAFILVLIPGDVTNNWTPRLASLPLFLALIPVGIAESYRKAIGEKFRK